VSALSTPVLVLNKDWAAIKFVTARKALRDLVCGIAHAVDVEAGVYNMYNFESWQAVSEYRHLFETEKHVWVRAVRQPVAVPKVIQLIGCKHFRKHRVKFTRRNIYARDNHTCQYCGNKFQTCDLNLDHVVPRAQGGQSTWENIVCSCVKCNSRKANRTPDQAGMKLIRKPKMATVTADAPRIMDPAWENFVDDAYWNIELKK